MVIYVNDYEDTFPLVFGGDGVRWMAMFLPYMGKNWYDSEMTELFLCPEERMRWKIRDYGAETRTYAVNSYTAPEDSDGSPANWAVGRYSRIRKPSSTFMFIDQGYNDPKGRTNTAEGWWYASATSGTSGPYMTHNKGANMVYMDVHTGWKGMNDFPPTSNVFWNPKK